MATPLHNPVSPEVAKTAATQIVRTLRDAGHLAYFAGGCVRDELLGLTPTDYDVATDATPDRIAKLFPRTAHVGASFGVMLVLVGRSQADGVIEVATFRADGTYSDARRPDSVRFSTPLEDAQRRDYTVNALFLDPLESDPGRRVIDLVGGVDDLHAKRLRAVGEPALRLREDHLRALRAVRLASRLGFEIEAATAEAIRREAALLSGVSRERIGDELRRMLLHPTASRAVGLLGELGLLVPVFGPVLDQYPTLRAVATGIGSFDVLAELPRDRSVSLAIAAVLMEWALRGPVPLAAIDPTRVALCLSNQETSELRAIVECASSILPESCVRIEPMGPGLLSLSVAGQKRAMSQPGFAAALALCGVVARGNADAMAAVERVRAQYEMLRATPSGLSPVPLLDGAALIGLGLKPGPMFKQLLDRVYDAQLEGRVCTPEQAVAMAREHSA